MTNKIPVGKKIQLARYARGLSLRQLENLSGINYASISYFETGKQSPRVDQYEALQAALNYSLESDAAKAAFSFFFNGS